MAQSEGANKNLILLLLLLSTFNDGLSNENNLQNNIKVLDNVLNRRYNMFKGPI